MAQQAFHVTGAGAGQRDAADQLLEQQGQRLRGGLAGVGRASAVVERGAA